MPAPLGVPIAQPRETFIDRGPARVLTGMLVLSALLHVLVLDALRGPPSSLPPSSPPSRREGIDPEAVRVTVIDQEIPATEPPEKIAPRPVVATVPRRRLPTPVASPSAEAPPPVAPPVPSESSPPPGSENAVQDLAPAIAPGLALSITPAAAGTMKVDHGGSPGGRPSGESAGPGIEKAYKAKEFADANALTEQPVFLNNVSAEQALTFYPEASQRDRFEGAVIVKLLVDDDGSVAQVTATNDPGHALAAAASQLARLYRFKPGRLNGRPVATEIRFTVRFELE